jgi:hypothetical protein
VPRARRSLSLAVLLACAPALAEGFGGEPEAAEDCVVEVDGEMVPCSAVLTDSPGPATKSETSSRSAPRREAEAKPAAEEKPEPKTMREKTRSPLADALEAQRANLEKPPLVLLREAVQETEERLRALEDKGASMTAQDAVSEELELLRSVLEDVEKRAEGRMLGCARRQDPKWAKRYDKGLATTRMTPAGPVKIKPRGQAMLDLAGCERTQFVDEDLIATVRRIHEIDRVLDNRRWRYGERAEERKLRAEKKELEASLGGGLPRLQPLGRDSESLYIKRPN